jgi:hypothetical protein
MKKESLLTGGANMGEARYLHDCEECVFLGTHERYDLYFCAATPTVIARYGVEGDYISGLILASTVPALAIATVRTISAGLLTTEQVRAITNA